MTLGTEPEARRLLTVRNLSISVQHAGERHRIVDNVSFDLERGRTLGLVGESGSGKTVTSLALLRLHDGGLAVDGGQILLGDIDVMKLGNRELRAFRGREIAMVFQDPMSSLDPSFTIGSQLCEVIRLRETVSRAVALVEAAELLKLVGISEPKKRLTQYPYEFSGGMRQRAAIAMAMAARPKLLIADEPTTALDVTTQAEVLWQLQELVNDLEMSMILTTHDLGIVASTCDDVAVMYAGRIVERGSAEQVFLEPRHPYTAALLACIPNIDEPGGMPEGIPGIVPLPWFRPSGCAFRSRCRFALAECANGTIPEIPLGSGRMSRCIRAREIELEGIAR